MSTVCINSHHNHLICIMMEIFRKTPNNDFIPESGVLVHSAFHRPKGGVGQNSGVMSRRHRDLRRLKTWFHSSTQGFGQRLRHLRSLTAANWVSFDFNISYSSYWGYSLINTLKLKRLYVNICRDTTVWSSAWWRREPRTGWCSVCNGGWQRGRSGRRSWNGRVVEAQASGLHIRWRQRLHGHAVWQDEARARHVLLDRWEQPHGRVARRQDA